MTTTVSHVISTKSITVTLAKAEPVSHPGLLWWTLSSDAPATLPPMGIAPDYALGAAPARALAAHYLAAAGVLPEDNEQPLLPWRKVGHTPDGADAYQVTITTEITAS